MNLLAPTDPRYLRRLVRECNALPDGFYADHGTLRARFNRTRFTTAGHFTSGGAFQARPIGDRRWLTLDPAQIASIGDAYGRNVCASRTP